MLDFPHHSQCNYLEHRIHVLRVVVQNINNLHPDFVILFILMAMSTMPLDHSDDDIPSNAV